MIFYESIFKIVFFRTHLKIIFIMKKNGMKNYVSTLLLLLFGYFLFSGITSCKKDDDDGNGSGGASTYVLIIENGAQKISPEQSVTYSARLIDPNGKVTTPDNVNWTTSDNQIATISSAGVINVVGQGMVTVKASVTIGDNTLTAQAPLGIYAPSIFTVAPAAILYEVGGSIQLEAIYLSPTGVIEPTCTYNSSDPSVASVSSSGLVTFNKAGSCYITVTATSLDGNPTNIVPVTVIGPITVPLPVVRVDVTPSSTDLFKNETVQLTAKAYNSDGQEVSGKTPVWTTGDADVVTVSSTGLVSPINPGEAFVYATIDGIMGQSYIVVNPDTLVIVEPFHVSIPAGGTQQFTAKTYHLTRNSATLLSGINYGWEIPTYGISMLDIATVNSSGLVTMKSDAMQGMVTTVIAYDLSNLYNAGFATIMAAIADPCNCGPDNPAVSYIDVNQTTVNLNMMGNYEFQIQAQAFDANDNPVQANLVYCTYNIAAADVDPTGLIIATGPGQATIKVCVGSVYKEITVNVAMM